MDPELDKLIRLQAATTELRKVEAELAEVPRQKTELDATLASERARLESAQEALDSCQKDRRRHEGELQDLETRRSRYKEQLMAVKTNREYTAMLHEIEAVEREIREREDLILEEMERAEVLTAELKVAEGRLEENEERHRVEAQALEQRSQTLEESVRRGAAERDAIAATLSEENVELFRRVTRFRGDAVTRALDGACGACHVTLRPQMFVDVKHNDEVRQCPSCSRILFYEPPAPVVPAPEP
jgi:predicted  nucleic acid-binding Zn-ribbon protein